MSCRFTGSQSGRHLLCSWSRQLFLPNAPPSLKHFAPGPYPWGARSSVLCTCEFFILLLFSLLFLTPLSTSRAITFPPSCIMSLPFKASHKYDVEERAFPSCIMSLPPKASHKCDVEEHSFPSAPLFLSPESVACHPVSSMAAARYLLLLLPKGLDE